MFAIVHAQSQKTTETPARSQTQYSEVKWQWEHNALPDSNSQQPHCDKHVQQERIQSVFALLPRIAKTTWDLECRKTSPSHIKSDYFEQNMFSMKPSEEQLLLLLPSSLSVFPPSFNPHPHPSFQPQCPSSSPLVVCCVTAAALFGGGEMNRLWAVIRYTAESMCSGARPGGGVRGRGYKGRGVCASVCLRERERDSQGGR